MADGIKDALYLRQGGLVGAPPAGVQAIIVDSDGTAKVIDSTGAKTAIGGCVPVSSEAYIQSLFQSKTGLSPLLIGTFGNDFTDMQKPATGGAGTASQGAQVSGTGATAGYNPARSGGVMKLLGPSSGAGFADLQVGAGGFNQISNMRTKRWLMAYQVAIGKLPSAASTINLGVTDGTNFIGIGYTGASATWKYQRGALPAITTSVDTTKAIDSSDAVYLWMYTYNDGTNVKVCADVLGGAAEVTGEASSALPAAAGRPYVWNEGAGAADIVELDTLVICVER